MNIRHCFALIGLVTSSFECVYADSLRGTFNIENVVLHPAEITVSPSGDKDAVPAQLEIVVETDKDFRSRGLFCHVSYLDQTGKLIKTFSDPQPALRAVSEADAARRKSTTEAWPTVILKFSRVSLFYPVPDKLPSAWNAVAVFGSSMGAVAQKYPQDDTHPEIDWNYPDKELVDSTPDYADFVDTDASTPLIEEKVTTTSKRYPVFTLIVHLPAGITNPKDVKGVLAMCLPVGTVEDLRAALLDPNKMKGGNYRELYRYAESRHLAVLAWGARFVFDSYASFDQLTDDQQRQWDEEFAPLADGWDKGVEKFVTDYGLPANNYLMYGTSAGAAWVHRVALMHPERFLAVHFHTCDTFHAPTPEGTQILWLETTGEEDGAYEEAQHFYVAARECHYPIIFKAYVGLGHRESSDAYRFGELFFDYALSLKAQAEAKAVGGDVPPLDLSQFANPPYVGDFMNQDVHPLKEINQVPAHFVVPLPTQQLADIWNK